LASPKINSGRSKPSLFRKPTDTDCFACDRHI
jgi:hypothetical protein